MISRLDDTFAAQQSMWSLVVDRRLRADAVRRPARRRPRAVTSGRSSSIGAVLLLLPMVPGFGRNINGARIWVDLGPLGFQPGEFAKLALAIFLAGYLSERRELIAASTWKIGPLRLPEMQYIAPDHRGVGLRRAGDGRRARPRLVADVLHPVRRDDVGRHRARQLPRDRASCCSGPRPTCRGGCSATCRPASTSGSTRGATSTARAGRSCSRCTASATAASPGAGSAAAPRTRSRTPRATSSSPPSARSWA